MEKLQVKDIIKTYRSSIGGYVTKALQNVSFSVRANEFVVLMGPSGCGKTTLLNIIAGIDAPDSGIVEINNNIVTTMKKDEMALFRRSSIGMIFQDFNLIDSLSVKENILIPLILDNRETSKMFSILDNVIDILKINEIIDKYPYEISGGQKQRVAIARALINDPSILIADEPTGNLDSNSTRVVMEHLKLLHDETGHTILMVTHDAYVASYANRVILLGDGEIKDTIINNGKREVFLKEIINATNSYEVIDEI